MYPPGNANALIASSLTKKNSNCRVGSALFETNLYPKSFRYWDTSGSETKESEDRTLRIISAPNAFSLAIGNSSSVASPKSGKRSAKQTELDQKQKKRINSLDFTVIS